MGDHFSILCYPNAIIQCFNAWGKTTYISLPSISRTDKTGLKTRSSVLAWERRKTLRICPLEMMSLEFENCIWDSGNSYVLFGLSVFHSFDYFYFNLVAILLSSNVLVVIACHKACIFIFRNQVHLGICHIGFSIFLPQCIQTSPLELGTVNSLFQSLMIGPNGPGPTNSLIPQATSLWEVRHIAERKPSSLLSLQVE